MTAIAILSLVLGLYLGLVGTLLVVRCFAQHWWAGTVRGTVLLFPLSWSHTDRRDRGYFKLGVWMLALSIACIGTPALWWTV